MDSSWKTMLPLLTFDTLASILYATFLHPFPVLLTALSLVALGHSVYSSIFKTVASYLVVVTISHLFRSADARIASGVPRKIKWKSEIVVVTGGAGGLGSALASLCGMRGANVAVVDILSLNEEKREEYDLLGIKYYECDVGDRKQVQDTAKAIEQDFGPPTILIDNAAAVTGKQFLDITEDDISRSTRVNVLSHYNTIQTFLPEMLRHAQGGTIVTISSILGRLGCAGLADYTAAKSFQTTLHNSLKEELRLLQKHPPAALEERIYPEKIKFVLVEPGQLNTPLFSRITTPSEFLAPKIETVDLARRIVEFIDKGRSGELAMPLYARFIPLLDVLPAGLRALVRSCAGLDLAAWKGFVLDKGQQR